MPIFEYSKRVFGGKTTIPNREMVCSDPAGAEPSR